MSTRGDSPRPWKASITCCRPVEPRSNRISGDVGQVGQGQPRPPQQRVPRRGDQAPVEREQVPVRPAPPPASYGAATPSATSGSRSSGLLDLGLGAGGQPDADGREGGVEPADGVDQDVEDQVLGGGDVDLPRAGRPEQLAQLPGPVQEREGVRQERLPLGGERRPPPAAALLVVQLDPEPLLQREQPVAQPLLGDVRSRAASRGSRAGPARRTPPPGRSRRPGMT